MPPNLLSFCLASTFDVLPSPSNLKRWRICTEASCSLCHKNICTTAHVLGSCKVALSQGRFTFRHDSVLSDIVESLKSFLLELPQTAPHKANKIAFVKQGKYLPKSDAKPKATGILHLANDWFLLSDLGEGYQFPGHIGISTLRPDIVMYSNLLKRVILIELTCPCEENMECWHNVKLNKYSVLVNIIRSNGWCVDIFAIEVGARGYCSRSVTSCLKALGFSNKLAFSTAKTVGQTSMKSSFCIWLARDSKMWCQPALISSLKSLSKPESRVPPPASSSNETEISFKPCDSPNPKIQKSIPSRISVPKHAGLLNKGNTCYANSILQAFSVIPTLWSQLPSEGSCQSPLVKATTLIMSLLHRSSNPIDPSNFLRALQNKIRETGNKDFNLNIQQDVPEVLNTLLMEFIGSSPLAEELVSNTIRTTTSCDVCFCTSIVEDKHETLAVPTKKHISMSLNDLLQNQSLTGDNMWFCPQCSKNQNATIESHIIKSGSILILQLKRYVNFQGRLLKDTKLVNCLPCGDVQLKVPIMQNDIVSLKHYSLVATINHSGSLNSGHYWAFIKENNIWFECNDRSVLQVQPPALNNTSCYVLFFVEI